MVVFPLQGHPTIMMRGMVFKLPTIITRTSVMRQETSSTDKMKQTSLKGGILFKTFSLQRNHSRLALNSVNKRPLLSIVDNNHRYQLFQRLSSHTKSKMFPPVLKFKKLSENAYAPVKGSQQAAGFDLMR